MATLIIVWEADPNPVHRGISSGNASKQLLVENKWSQKSLNQASLGYFVFPLNYRLLPQDT
jgi:hypothetical protein